MKNTVATLEHARWKKMRAKRKQAALDRAVKTIAVYLRASGQANGKEDFGDLIRAAICAVEKGVQEIRMKAVEKFLRR